jgi:hypothetical protein
MPRRYHHTVKLSKTKFVAFPVCEKCHMPVFYGTRKGNKFYHLRDTPGKVKVKI